MRDAPPDVFVYAGQLICDSARGRPRRRQVKITCRARDHRDELTIGQRRGTIDGQTLHAPAAAVGETFACHYWYLQLCFRGVDNLEARVCLARNV